MEYEAKFAVGALVRGKDNKRSREHDYANRLGIVITAGYYMNVKFTTGPLATKCPYLCSDDFVTA